MSSKSKKILILFFILLVALLYFVINSLSEYREMTVVMGGKKYSVLVARTSNELTKGLSGRVDLAGDEGMLFEFRESRKYGFWMKDMNFPLDIVWISDDNKIVHIEKSLATSTYPEIFYPENVARYVLEVNAGESDKLNIKIGDSVGFFKK